LVSDPADASTLQNKGHFGESLAGGALRLDYLEAVYLQETGRVELNRDGEPVRIEELLRLASQAEPSFDVKYLVYRDLRSRGYVLHSADGFIDFTVLPRGGVPGKTPAKYWARALSERTVFDLGALSRLLEQVSRARKKLLLSLVDEESDITYYLVKQVEPQGRIVERTLPERTEGWLLEDRVLIPEEASAERLHQAGFYGKKVGNRLYLSLLEAAYLQERGSLELRDVRTKKKIPPARLRSRARAGQPDFDLRYSSYERLKSRGIIVKTGFKYGAHFRAYQGDPETQHALYLIHSFPREHRGLWPEISRAVRVAHGVRKEILLCRVGEELEFIRLERIRP